ncbi:MAG TPA: SEC-C metal-binding domain-containing protein [Salinivirgaceae bacterium]|mgnify:CR=1 FL=1|nr:SEC-C metal-binding domain-containing protein [Salinivirgaceae bacterium]HQA76495.1 SEC-C metal-binding domain-containing protein [Salinivirgaceae bacterium]
MMVKSKFPFNVVLDPIQDERSELYVEELKDIYTYVKGKNKPNLKKVERFFQRWKQYPEAWNFYYSALTKNDRHIEAEKLLLKTRDLFPNYFYGLHNSAKRLIFYDRLEEAIEVLGGDTPDINRWFPDTNTFWIEHVVHYYLLFAELEIKRENYDKADDIIKYVYDYFYLKKDGPQIGDENIEEVSAYVHDVFSNVTQQIMLHRMEKGLEKLKNHKPKEPKYVHPVISDDYKNRHRKGKSFYHSEVNMLFEHETLNKETINTILSLPRSSVIADLEQVMYHTMFEFTDEDFERNEYYALPHAIWFLYELNAVETMETACLLLQKEDDFTDFWFGDFWVNDTWFYYYMLVKHDHRQLLEVLYLPNKNAFVKSTLLDAIEQLAFHHPERKDEVIEWLTDLLQFYVDNQTNNDIIDAPFVGFIESSLIDLNVKNSLPILKILHEADCVDEWINGGYADVVKYFENPPFLEKRIMELPDIYTLAEKEIEMIERWKKEKKNQKAESYYPQQPEETEITEVKRSKVGRNDPCPCGSGKKFKKCCGMQG